MPYFSKDVLSPGSYHASGLDGLRRKVTYSRADCEQLAGLITAMLNAGLMVPVSWDHQDDAKPVSHGERLAKRARNVCGYLTGARLDRDATLYVELEVDDEDDARR